MGLAVIHVPIPSSILVRHYQNKDPRDRILNSLYDVQTFLFLIKEGLKKQNKNKNKTKQKQNKTKQNKQRKEKKNYAEGDDLEDNL